MSKFEVIRCSSCGSTHVENFGDRIGKCGHCGSTMLLPRPNEEIIAMLNAAQVYRENYNYDLAIKSYQFVLEKDSNELSAYEGIILSKYGIEYVKDSYSGKLIPTCHRAHFKSIYEDEYYQTLMALLNEEQKQVISEKIKDIDKLQKAIERQLKNEQEYDVFISYKATDNNGDKTEDSVIAREIYEELIKKNYRVFLAEKSLEDRLGSEYEPIIFKALHTSKIFILVGTSKENVEANWVRNEWSRFIDRIKNNEDLPKGCFIPVFKNMNPYDMPKVNNTFVQGVDAGKLGYLVTIADGVTKILKPEKEQKVLKAFEDVDNFAEFERIKKEKKRELKKKRWQEFKAKDGIKKYLYMAFLYSPYFFGALALLFGCFLNSHFRKDPAFVLNAVFWSLAIISTILTICVHIPKFGVRPFINIVNPWALIVLATLTYQVFCYPITIENDRFDFYSSDYQENGIIYSRYSDSINIVNLIKGKYKVNVKMIDGKKTLILPNYSKGEKISYMNGLVVPDDIECVVLPKNVRYATLKVNEATFKEVYCYGVYEEKYHDSVRTTNISVLNKNGSGLEGLNFTCYYEITEPFIGGIQSNPNINIVQKDSRFY